MHLIFKDISFIYVFQCFQFSFLYITVFPKRQYFYLLIKKKYNIIFLVFLLHASMLKKNNMSICFIIPKSFLSHVSAICCYFTPKKMLWCFTFPIQGAGASARYKHLGKHHKQLGLMVDIYIYLYLIMAWL
jgi:hypothetical protein